MERKTMKLSVALERYETVAAQQGGVRVVVMPWQQPGMLMLQTSYTEPDEYDLMMRAHRAPTLKNAEAWLERQGLSADADWERG